MRSHATASALALLLLAAGVSTALGPCCPSSRTVERTIRSLDCCAAMLEHPVSPQSAITTAVRSTSTLPTEDSPSDAPPAPAPRFPSLTTVQVRLGALAARPPLYRLHAQLLI